MRESEAQELDRLGRFLTRPGPRFGLALAIVRDFVVAAQLRELLRERVAAGGTKVAQLELGADDARTDLVAAMVEAAQGVDVLFVVGLDWVLLDDRGRSGSAPAIANLNQRRDALPELLDVRVVFWLGERGHQAMREQAWDLRQIMLSVAKFDRQLPAITSPLVAEIESAVQVAAQLAGQDEGIDLVETWAINHATTGSSHRQSGRLDAAIASLSQLAALADRLDNGFLRATALDELGVCLRQAGELVEAITYHRDAIHLASAEGRHQPEFWSHMGLCYLATGDLAGAQSMQRRALSDYAKRDSPAQARCLNNIGAAQLLESNVPDAIESFLDALKIDDIPLIHANLGLAWLLLGDDERAIKLLEPTVAENLDSLVNAVSVLVNLGVAQRMRGDVAAASDSLSRALAVAEPLGNPCLRADALANLGFLADGPRARELLEQARELYTSYGHAAPKLALVEQVLSGLDTPD